MVNSTQNTEDRVALQISFPFWTAYLASLRLIFYSPAQIIACAIFPAGGIFLICLALFGHLPLGIGNILLVVVCVLFTPITTALALFLARRRNPLSEGPFAYIFDADGIQASGSAFELKLKWSTLQKVRESGRFLFLFTAPSRAQCLPTAQVRAAGQLQALREMLQRHMANVRTRID